MVSGKSQLAKSPASDLSIHKLQVGQLKTHVWNHHMKTAAPQHKEALDDYKLRAAKWKRLHWDEVGQHEEPPQQDIEACRAKLREAADVERLNAVHDVYSAIYRKQSHKEYVVNTTLAKIHGGKYYGDLYMNPPFYEKVQGAFGNRLFEQTWEKLVKSPVLVVCSDEADGHLGIRVQFMEIGEDHVAPSSAFLQLQQLSDATAKGISDHIISAFTSPTHRPKELAHLVLSCADFARKLRAFVGDGATVNGLCTNARTGPRAPVEFAKPGENVFRYLTDFRREHYHSGAETVGVWCKPHQTDLVSDALSNNETRLPTFFKFGRFLKKLCSHLDFSGKAKADIEFLNKLIVSDVASSGALHISVNTWMSNAKPMAEILRGTGVIYEHLLQTEKHSTGLQKKTSKEQREVLEDPKIHFVFPAYLDL